MDRKRRFLTRNRFNKSHRIKKGSLKTNVYSQNVQAPIYSMSEARHLEDIRRKSFVCNVCNKTFTRHYDLNVRNGIHTSEMPYVCYTCDTAFRRRQHSVNLNSLYATDKDNI